MRDISAVELFPFDSFREKQEKLLEVAERKLENDQIDNVIVNAPTGVGKSAVNTALARKSDSAFMTTPQKKLRQQLADDADLNPYYEVLRARRDYICGESGDNCDDCWVNKSAYEKCSDFDGCTYWKQKNKCINDRIAVLTFAYLIVDSQMPDAGFNNRELLVVDEAQNIDTQAAELYMGFEISPWELPFDIYNGALKGISQKIKEDDDIISVVEKCHRRAEQYIEDNQDREDVYVELKKCRSFVYSAGQMIRDYKLGNKWVVNMGFTSWNGQNVPTAKCKPISVGYFLRKNVWERAEKRVISTATMMYRTNPEKWCWNIGLDPDRTSVINVSMPFDVSNRPIYTGTIIGNMSSGGDDTHWPEIMETIDELANEHVGQRGLIHTASYKRAERFYDDAYKFPTLKDNVYLHRTDSSDDIVEEWQKSDKDIMVTPSMTEGVDLKGDMCRWQALMKVPFPSPADSRVWYLLNKKPGTGWPWYYEKAACSIVQSAGRAVRSKDDWASFYVLDGAFNKVRNRVDFPPWFEDAIIDETFKTNSVI